MQRSARLALTLPHYRATFVSRAFSTSSFAMGRVTVLDSFDAYQKAINGDKPAVIDFHAVWCGPCKVISPKFNGFSDDFSDLDFYSVDVDDQPEIAQACKIQAMPTFQVFKAGELADEFKGAYPDKLHAMIAKAAGN